jgi:pectate lyase
VASGTAPLTYQWKFGSTAISGATGASLTLTNVQSANAGSYTVTVTNSVGSVTSTAATLTVGASGSNTKYNLTGFATIGTGCTGGGVIATTDAGYVQVTTPLELATAMASANKGNGVKVIEIMNDLNLGWNEIGSAVQSLSNTPFNAAATALLHPALITAGVSRMDIKPKTGGLTIFSANGATIKHCTFNIKSTTNIIVRNLKFDEMWEWDESSKGNYDKNDWDFIDIGNGGTTTNIWIDHCTFTKSYDGILDTKAGSGNITISWCKYIGDDGATNSNSFVRQQINSLEAKKSSYAFYNFLRTNGYSVENIVQIIQAHDKTHLAGSNDLDPNNATITMTFHHQYFNGVWDRCVPRLRAGNVHDYNIYVDDTKVLAAKRLRDSIAATMSTANQNTLNNTYSFNPPINGSISTENGAILVEKSVYLDCLWTLRNNQTDITNPAYTGKIKATDTIYHMDNADGTVTDVRGNSTDSGNPMGPFQAPIIAFSWNGFSNLPYAYTPDDPASLLSLVQAGAGAGTLTWDKSNWLKISY